MHARESHNFDWMEEQHRFKISPPQPSKLLVHQTTFKQHHTPFQDGASNVSQPGNLRCLSPLAVSQNCPFASTYNGYFPHKLEFCEHFNVACLNNIISQQGAKKAFQRSTRDMNASVAFTRLDDSRLGLKMLTKLHNLFLFLYNDRRFLIKYALGTCRRPSEKSKKFHNIFFSYAFMIYRFS